MENLVDNYTRLLDNSYSQLVIEILNYFNSQRDKKYRIISPEEFQNDLKNCNIIGKIRIEKMKSNEVEKNFIEVLFFPVTNVTLDTRYLVNIEDENILLSYYSILTDKKISDKIENYITIVGDIYNIQFDINTSSTALKEKLKTAPDKHVILAYYLFLLQYNTIRGTLDNESKSKLNLLNRLYFKGKFKLKRKFTT